MKHYLTSMNTDTGRFFQLYKYTGKIENYTDVKEFFRKSSLHYCNHYEWKQTLLMPGHTIILTNVQENSVLNTLHVGILTYNLPPSPYNYFNC